MGVALGLKILISMFSLQIQKLQFWMKLNMRAKFIQNISELNKNLISLMIIGPDPILQSDISLGVSLQVIFEDHKNLLTFKRLQNHLSLGIIDENYWRLDVFIKRVLIGNGILHLVARLIMDHQHSQSLGQIPLVGLTRVSTDSSLDNKNELSFGLGMPHRLAPIGIVILRSQHLDLVLFLIGNLSKGADGVVKSSLNSMVIQLVFKGLGFLNPKSVQRESGQ